MRNIYLLTLAFVLASNVAQAQNNQWTLEKSVAYALQNNLQVRQLDIQREQAEAQLTANRLSRLPNVGANLGYGIQLGRTIDPTTNSFEQQNITFSNVSVSAQATIYNGGRINNSIKQAKLDAQAAGLEADATANDVALSVANAYLTVLLAREQLSNARAQLQLTADQLEQTDAGIQAGSLPESQRFDLVAQQAANQRTIIDLENQVRIALVNLQINMQLDPSDDFNIITPNLEITDRDLVEDYSYEEVYLSATQTQPDIKAAELRSQSSAYSEKIARSGYLPTLSIGASLNSNYSSLGREADTSNVSIIPGPEVPVLINGVPTTISEFQLTGLEFRDKSYFDQINENFGQSVSLNLNVPIYSQGRNNLAVQQAKLQKLGADLQKEQAVNNLKNEVIIALTDLRGARQAYEAAETSLDASTRSYEVTKRRFDLGAANNLDLITATNRLDQARIEMTRAKYQLIFNQQVIEFYLGRPLSLN
ncbi:hypothetical protein CEQ90_04270 [Lewinellaceae bacterium SD302]|nr:hypothetical protein CEQ90_04270 [Lewinellaceae bacterium SD302]